MTLQHYRFAGAALLTALAALAGCTGSAGPTVHPAGGVVTYRGAPVEGAVVAFQVEGAAKLSVGTTDAQGRFRLTTDRPDDGAPAGKCLVTVTKSAAPAAADAGPTSMEAALAAGPTTTQAENLLPPRYASTATSGLTFEVRPGGPNEFTLDLTD